MSATDLQPRPAFRPDAAGQRLRSLARAAWFAGAAAAGRLVVRPEFDEVETKLDIPPPSRLAIRRAYAEAFSKDARDIAAGLYPPAEDGLNPVEAARSAADVITDARAVEARRRRRGGTEAREDAGSDAYPIYYRQNFHYQSGGWFTPESARRYEDQVETLFAGAAGPMRRRALSLLAQAWRGRDHRGLRVLDLACGSGAFLADLKRTFPRAGIAGLDLSPAYLDEARRRSGVEAVVQAPAERLPFADASLDAVTCVYLFHELPPRVRPQVAAEITRVLKPGGVLALADSVQAADEPELARMLQSFPAYFHEPYYGSYQNTDLPSLFAEAGLELAGADKAFLTKAWLFSRRCSPAERGS
jgi:ubiquinone/menaquinone biosynthesis C-methylase UbiE